MEKHKAAFDINILTAGLEQTKWSQMYNYQGSYITYGVCQAPTSNCQIFSIMYAEGILVQPPNVALEHFTEIQRYLSKPQVLVDISTSYLPRLKDIFSPECFLVESPYKNATGRSMVICLINILNNKIKL